MAMSPLGKEAKDTALSAGARPQEQEDITDNMTRGLDNGSPTAKQAMDELIRQRGSFRGIFGDVLAGAAAGSKAAEGAMNPLVAFTQGMAAGLQAPGLVFEAKRRQLQSTLDASPLSVTMPELGGPNGQYPHLGHLPTKLAIETIQKIAIDTQKIVQEERSASVYTPEELTAYSAVTGIRKDVLSGLRKQDAIALVKAMRSGAGEPGVDMTKTRFQSQEKDLADAYGVPAVRVNPYFGQSDDMVSKTLPAQVSSSQKDVEEARASASQAEEVEASLKRASGLLDSGLNTGPIVGRIPGRTLGKDAQEFVQISNKLLPSMRSGMPGAVSDRDMDTFRKANIGLDKDEDVNRKVIAQGLAVAQRNKDYAEFLSGYSTVHGDIAGAKSAWKGYADRFPLFDRDGAVLPTIPFHEYFKGLNEKRPRTVAEASKAAGGVRAEQDASNIKTFVDPRSGRTIRGIKQADGSIKVVK